MATDYPKCLYDTRFKDAVPVASTTAAGDYDVLNINDFAGFTWWKPSALPATITVDCGSAKTADYVAIYGHDLGSKGVTLEVRGSTDNFVGSNVLVHSYAPSDDATITRFFTSTSFRYWRLRFVNGTAPTLAIALVGNLLDIPEYLTEGFDPIGRNTVGIYNKSQTGEALGTVVRREEWEEKISFSLLSWAWIRGTWLPAWRVHLRASAFLFAWNGNNYPGETLLVSVKQPGGFMASHHPGSYADMSLTLVGRIA